MGLSNLGAANLMISSGIITQSSVNRGTVTNNSKQKRSGNYIADLSALGTLNPVELDLDGSYPAIKENTFRLLPKGVYPVQAPSEFPSAAFGRTAKGALSVQIDPTVLVDPPTTVKFVKISSTTFDRNGKKVSQIGDYLRAIGYTGKITGEQELANAVEQTAGKTYQAKLDWRAYNKRTGFQLEGMEKFPKLEDGTYQSWLIDPAEVGKTDDQGRQLRVFANLTIPFGGFIPAQV